jgi:hypothetical protein
MDEAYFAKAQSKKESDKAAAEAAKIKATALSYDLTLPASGFKV